VDLFEVDHSRFR